MGLGGRLLVTRARGLPWLLVAAASGGCASLLGIGEPDVVNGDDGGGTGDSASNDDASGDVSPEIGPGDGSMGTDTMPGSDSALGDSSVDTTGTDGPLGDSSTSDTFVADTSMPDTSMGVDSGPLGPCSGGILCDNFEEGMIDKTIWPGTLLTTGGTVSVDTVYAHSGTHSLHSHVPATAQSNTGAGLAVNDGLSLPPLVYVRLWVLLPGTPPAQLSSYLGLIQGVSPYDGINVGIIGNNPFLQDYGSPPADLTSASTVALDPWLCIQATVDATSGSMGNVSISMGKALIGDLQPTGVWAGPLGQLHVGGYVNAVNAAQPAYDVWIDDVYVDSAPVGCDSP